MTDPEIRARQRTWAARTIRRLRKGEWESTRRMISGQRDIRALAAELYELANGLAWPRASVEMERLLRQWMETHERRSDEVLSDQVRR